VSSPGPCPYDKPLPKERLIRCLQQLFQKWNPGAPIGIINWDGVSDSTLTLAENLENFEKKYPAFRWREPEPEEEAREQMLEEVRRSVEAALNAGYRPADIAEMIREALKEEGVTKQTIERTLSALNLPTEQPPPAQPQPARAPPPPPPAPPPAQTPPSFTSIKPRREVREEDVLHAQSALEGWLWRSLRNEEYQRFEAECVARSKTVDELMDCAWRLYEEFSKRPIQLPATKPQQAQPQERARPPTRVTDRRGMTLPVAGSRKGLPISLGGGKANIPLKGGGKAEIPIAPHRERVTGPPGWFPYVIVLCTRDGGLDIIHARTADQAKERAMAFVNANGKVLCYGLEDECREWIEKYESGETVDECVQHWAGYYGP